MRGDWRRVRIGELGRVVTGRTPRGNDKHHYGDAVPFLTPSDMDDRRSVDRPARHLSAFGAAELNRCLVPQGVGVSCIGWQMGKAVLIERPTITNQQINSIIIDPAVADRMFVYYALCSRRSEFFKLGAGGSRTPILNKGDFEKLPFVLPPVLEQLAIARILGALDDKIELNRKMTATLEAIARALFKSWFVDEPEADWRTGPLADWVDVLSGGTPSKSNAMLWGGSLKWISPKAMTSIHADECDDHVTEQAVGRGTRIAPKGSTLVMVRGMGLHDGVRVSQAREDVTFNQDVKALVPKHIEADLLLFAMLDAQQDLHKRVETSGHGTGKMPSDMLLVHPITMPPREIQRERVVHIAAMNDRIAANRAESKNLARLRNELLPRLLSGELSTASGESLAQDEI